MIIYRGKRLKVTKAVGFRLGIAYLPNWVHNKDTEQPRSAMVWCGPYIFVWAIKKKGWKPRELDDEDRVNELLKARQNLNLEIAQAHRIKWRRQRLAREGYREMDEAFERTHGVHMDVERRWQAESDAVKLRDMENAERERENPSDI